MPNHCESDLWVGGPIEDVKLFEETARGPNTLLDLNNFIPYPARFKDIDTACKIWWKENATNGERYGPLKPGVLLDSRPKDGFNSGGYEWRCKNWGTKWGLHEVNLDDEYTYEDEKCAERMYTFQSAWTPPLPVIAKMAADFPTLDFRLCYFERGGEFSGRVRYKDGCEVSHEQAKYFGRRGG